MTPRCPQYPNPKGGNIVGCGSANVEGPDKEGLYDCLDCGIWFTSEEAESSAPEAVAKAEGRD